MDFESFDNLIWSVSEEGKALVKSGEACFSSGGIRSKKGELVELAVPIIKSSSGELSAPPVLSAINPYSSNQLKVMIKNGSKLTNSKLEKILSMSSQLCKNSVLNWANAAIGLANSGLSYVFYKKQTKLMTLFFEEQDKKIDEIIELLNCINNKIEEIDNRNRAERIRYFINQSDTDISELLNHNYDIKKENRNISSFLNKFASFMESLLTDYEKGDIQNDFYVQSIFLLGTLFTKEVELFSLQYYQRMGHDHKKSADYWYGIVNRIDNCKPLKDRIWNYIMLQSPEISPLEKRDYYNVLIASFSNHKYNMEINHYLEKRLEINTNVKTLDEILTEKIIKDEALII